MNQTWVVAAVTVIAFAGVAHAEKKKKLDGGGRIFVRDALTRAADRVYEMQASLQSVRVKLDYRWDDRVSAEVEAELSHPKIKDAWIKLRAADGAARLDLRAGQFKLPFSAIELTSQWRLPTADRGLLHEVLDNRLQVAGRRVGAQLELTAPDAAGLEVDAGVFQGQDDNGDPLSVRAADGFGQDASLRVSVTPTDGLTIAASGQLRAGRLVVLPIVIDHGWAAGLDATFDRAIGCSHLRVWLEGFAGSSWLVAANDTGHTRARFAGGRAIAAWRWGGDRHGDRFVEPYALAGALDPDSIYQRDFVSELTAGIGYGSWNVWRVQLEAERWRIQPNAPVGIAEQGIPPAPTTTWLVQVGAHL